jgi:hypothetical protein
MATLRVEKSSSNDFNDFGPCECCGDMSRTVWGDIKQGDATVAVYFVHWTLNRIGVHGAHFDLVMGSWAQDSQAQDRYIISLAYRVVAGKPQFMVIDSGDRPVAQRGLASRALSRQDVISTPLAATAFEMVDAIWLGDERINELTVG